MIKKNNFKKGQMLIIGILFMAILLIFSTTIFSSVRSFINFGSNSSLRQQALHLAVAGVEKAAKELKADSSYAGEANTPIGTTGTFTITVTSPGTHYKTITSTGFVPNASNPKAKQIVQIDATPTANSQDFLEGIGVQFHTIVKVGNFMYSLGGNRPGAPTLEVEQAVQFASINPDNSTGSWDLITTPPPFARSFYGATTNGYIYLIGGINESGQPTTGVYFTQPDLTDGSIDYWTPTTNTPTGGLFAAIADNGYVYIVGEDTYSGPDWTGVSAKIYWAKQNPDGSLGSWNLNTYELPANRSQASAAIANGYLYVIGGVDYPYGPGNNSIFYGKLNSHTDPNDGTVGPFATNTNLIPIDNILNTTTTVLNDYLYIFGGWVQITDELGGVDYRDLNDIYYGKVNPNGSVDTIIKDINGLPDKRCCASSIGFNNFLYEIGGYKRETNQAYGNVWMSEPNPATGQPGDWSDNLQTIGYGEYELDKSTYHIK